MIQAAQQQVNANASSDPAAEPSLQGRIASDLRYKERKQSGSRIYHTELWNHHFGREAGCSRAESAVPVTFPLSSLMITIHDLL